MIGIGRKLEVKVGFGFRPTDDELVGFYLRNRIEGNLEVLESINEVDICSFDPWELRLQAKIKSRDPIWYFFSRRENKYASGNRQSRRTISGSGFWKLTGESVDVKDQWGTWCGYAGKIGQKRVLGFHRGKSGSSKGVKSDWVIHEYHFTLLPEEKRTYVVCRLEYKGEDRNMLTDSAIEPAPTQSAGSVINQSLHGNPNTFAEYDSASQGQQFNGFSNLQQSLQGYSGSYNNLSEYDSATQGQQFNGFVNPQQSLEGYSGSYNNLSEYDLANQNQHLTGNYNVQQSVQGNPGSYNNLFEYDSANQNQHLSGNFNVQQPVQENQGSFINYSDFGYDLRDEGQWFNQQPPVPYSDEWENSFAQNLDNMMYERTLMEQNNSNYLPKKPVAGVLADDISDSDTDSMICKDVWSSTDSVASSNGSYHTPYSLPSRTVKPLHHYKAQERPKPLVKLQSQRKEKLISKQMSECKCKMAEDLIKKASSIKMVNEKWIVLEEVMSQRNSKWIYLMKMIIGFLLLISIIGWIILAD